jgi:hypothetical protein
VDWQNTGTIGENPLIFVVDNVFHVSLAVSNDQIGGQINSNKCEIMVLPAFKISGSFVYPTAFGNMRRFCSLVQSCVVPNELWLLCCG